MLSTNQPALNVDPVRRLFLKGVASLPLAYVLADVELAKAAAHGGQTVSIQTDLAGEVTGYLAEPEDKNAPTVILIHEWWGLNEHIKAAAQEFKEKGFRALAVDLFKGSVASDRDGAMAQIKALNPEGRLTMNVRVDWAKNRGNGKVGTCGWCFVAAEPKSAICES